MKKSSMRKTAILACSAVLALSLVACSGSQAPSGGLQEEAAPAAPAASSNPLEAILSEAQADVSGTSQKLIEEKEKVFAQVGDTYDGYTENVQAVQGWYDLAISETEGLGERLREQGREYYQAVVDNVDVADDREVEKATDEYYDQIYDDALDDYYDAIYEDAFEEFYDAYYDGAILDAQDITPYDEWYDVRSEAYEAWFDGRSHVHKAWFDARSDLYSDYSDIKSAFYGNDFDVEGVFGPVKLKEDAAAPVDADESQSESSAAAETEALESSDAEVSADLKAAMDEYEAFFDEYVAFMKEYKANPSSADLLAKYPDMMAQYSEAMAAIGEIDSGEFTAADAAYYSEAVARITAKVAEAA